MPRRSANPTTPNVLSLRRFYQKNDRDRNELESIRAIRVAKTLDSPGGTGLESWRDANGANEGERQSLGREPAARLVVDDSQAIDDRRGQRE